MNDVRIIKRYANRKLYDTQHSRYVTLDQISEMIRNGDDVKIIDNKTKEDLTSVTLAQIIFEEEKKQRSFLPLQAMRNIIQNGGESFAQLVNEAQRRVTSILPLRKEGEEGEGEGEATDGGEAAASDGSDAATTEAAASEGEGGNGGVQAVTTTGDDSAAGKRGPFIEFREWIQQSQRTIEEWQKRVDDRIRNVAEGISPLSGLHKEVHTLASRIAELEAKLAEVAEKERAAAAGKDGSDGQAATGDQAAAEQAPSGDSQAGEPGVADTASSEAAGATES